MGKKVALLALIGALAAGLSCLIVGLILFFVLRENAIVIIGSFIAICMGASMTAVAGVALAIFLTVWAIDKKKHPERYTEENNNENSEENNSEETELTNSEQENIHSDGDEND